MVLATGTNCITEAEDKLIAMIADCPSFQLFCGVSSAAQAVDRIHVDELPDPPNNQDNWTEEQWQEMFPLCLITPPEDGSQASVISDSMGERIEYYADLAFNLVFEAYPFGGDPQPEERRKFKNVVGEVTLSQLGDRARQFGFGYTKLDSVGEITQGHYTHAETSGETFRWRWAIERVRG